jgi:hypothetical protein
MIIGAVGGLWRYAVRSMSVERLGRCPWDCKPPQRLRAIWRLLTDSGGIRSSEGMPPAMSSAHHVDINSGDETQGCGYSASP